MYSNSQNLHKTLFSVLVRACENKNRYDTVCMCAFKDKSPLLLREVVQMKQPS